MSDQKANMCSGVATVLVLVAFALGVVSCIIPDFVTASLVVNPTMNASLETTGTVEFAGLGVYQTEYDPKDLSELELSASGLPTDALDTSTTEFPLLFPGQTNFVAQVVPVTIELLEGFGALADAAVALVGPSVDAVNDLTFDSCEQYLDDAQVALLELFTTTATLISQLPIPIFQEQADVLSNLATIEPSIITNQTQTPVFSLFAANFDTAAGLSTDNCAQLGVDLANETLASTLDATEYACLGAVYGAIVGSLGLPDAPAAFVAAAASGISTCADIPVLTCLVINGGALTDVEFGNANVTFIGTDLCVNSAQCSTLAEYTEVLLDLSTAVFQINSAFEDFVTALTTYNVLTLELSVSGAGSSLEENINSVLSAPPPLPTDFADAYLPCNMLSALSQLGGLDQLSTTPEGCGLIQWLAGASAGATNSGSSLAPVLDQIFELYGGCFSVTAGAGIPFTPQQCPQVWGPLFINGAFQGDIENAEVILRSALNASSIYLEIALPKCLDDVTDTEKIETAQALVGIGTAGFGLAMLMGVSGFSASQGKGMLRLMTGAFAAASGTAIFAALLTVQSAPIYDNVEDDSELFAGDIEYETGIIPVLGFVSFVLGIGAGLLFAGAGVIGLKSMGGEAEKPEPKQAVTVNPVAEPVEEKEPLPAKEIKAEEDGKASV